MLVLDTLKPLPRVKESSSKSKKTLDLKDSVC